MLMSWSEEDQAYIVSVPELPGCMADGKTPEKAVKNTEIIIQEWIETAKENGEEIPKPSFLNSLSVQEVGEITIKQKVEAACAMAGITVTELGRQMGMSQQNISKRLKTGKFTQEELEKMAEIMGCEYHSFFVFPNGSKAE